MKIHKAAKIEVIPEMSVEISFAPESPVVRKDTIKEFAAIIGYHGKLIDYTKQSENLFIFFVEMLPRKDGLLIESLRVMSSDAKNRNIKVNSDRLIERKKKPLNILLYFIPDGQQTAFSQGVPA